MGLQATNAGIDFQQRVSAYMMILMEFDIDVSIVLQLSSKGKIKGLSFEAPDNIDDLVIELDSGEKIYFQMKRTISLSTSSTSEFYSVCDQFVRQYLEHNSNDIAYVLATRSETSKAITVKLKRILDGIRLANSLEKIEELNSDEREDFEKLKINIQNIYKSHTKKNMSDEDLLKVLLLSYIEVFDIETGEELERTIKIILSSKIDVDPALFWQALISKAVDYGGKRRYLSKEALQDQCASYVCNSSDLSVKTEETFFKKVWTGGIQDIPVRYDWIAAVPTDQSKEKIKIENDSIFVFELQRFTDSGKKEYPRYVCPDRVEFKNGLTFELLFRCATYERMQGFLENELSTKSNPDEKLKVVFVPLKNHNQPCAIELLHQEALFNSQNSQKKIVCINCGKAIFDNNSSMIEIDNCEYHDVLGMAHQGCIRPIDRVLGTIHIPNVDNYSYLKNFDIILWEHLIRNNKNVWDGISQIADCSTMIIDPNDVFHDGNHCIYFQLKDGNKRYITSKGKIDKLSKRGAEELLSRFSMQLKQAKEDGNPYGYSSKSFTFGQYDTLIGKIGDKEDFVECVSVHIGLYNEFLSKIYNNSDNYYAPIVYLTVDGDPVVFSDNVFPLLTSPFDLSKYISNWNILGVNIPDYDICIIKDDNEFILKMVSMITAGIFPVVNPMYNSSHVIIHGLSIHLSWEMQSELPLVDNPEDDFVVQKSEELQH